MAAVKEYKFYDTFYVNSEIGIQTTAYEIWLNAVVNFVDSLLYSWIVNADSVVDFTDELTYEIGDLEYNFEDTFYVGSTIEIDLVTTRETIVDFIDTLSVRFILPTLESEINFTDELVLESIKWVPGGFSKVTPPSTVWIKT